MAWKKHELPEINAGSMADIAFLLLIFFLVTTTMDVDGGIQRKLPPLEDQPIIDKPIHQRNLLTVYINAGGKLMVKDQEISIQQLREATVRFLDNNGDGSCSYCEGPQTSDMSDNPAKAIVSLQNDRETPYRMYIAVQNELTAAYNELRDREAHKQYGTEYGQLSSAQQEEIQRRFPQKISEAEPLDL
ncbi:MAG: ExbD/TolR family protein [Owenweeksia sp.]